MNYIIVVQIADSRKDLFHGFSGEFFTKISHIGDFIEKFASMTILTDNIKILVILEELENFHDIWMILLESG